MYPNYLTAAELIPEWRAGILDGKRPILYPVGDGGFSRVRIGPGLLMLLGGPPGLGKTALGMQMTLDALRATPDLRALVCNVEMTPAVLLDRQLSRLSGIDYSLIRDRAADQLPRERLNFGFAALDDVADRLAFLESPYTLEHVATAADGFRAGLIVLDYLQRIPATTNGTATDPRQALNVAMQYLRRFTDAGQAVIAVSALARGKGKAGSTYDGAGLASFRDSSEVEYGGDDCYLLAPAKADAGPGALILHHLKARHGEPCSLAMQFDGAHQSFTALDLAEQTVEGLTPETIADVWSDAGGDE